MNIKIGDKYMIGSDRLNWILKERRVTDPNHPRAKSKEVKERYVDIGYYGRIDHLVNRLLELELKQSDVNTLGELLEHFKQIGNDLKNEVERVIDA